MKTSAGLSGLAAFAAAALFALNVSEGRARPTAAPSLYSNAEYGFSLVPPAFSKGAPNTSVQAAMFFAPAQQGFASNLNVIVQTSKMSLDEYSKLSRSQMKEAGLKIVSETRRKVSGRDAVLWEYEGTLQDRELKWVALAVVDSDRIFLLTGTASKAESDSLGKIFQASLDSFKLND